MWGQVAIYLRRRHSVALVKRPVKTHLMEPARQHARGKIHILGSLAPLGAWLGLDIHRPLAWQ